MNLSTPGFAILGIIVLVIALLSPKRLVAVWAISILVLPLLRYRVGEAPIYFHDFVIVILLAVSFARTREDNVTSFWPSTVPRWHLWVSGSAFVLSVVMGSFQQGWSLATLWIWGHLTLAWIAFALGVLTFNSRHGDGFKSNLRLGILVSACILAPVALIQYLDLPPAGRLMQFFYADIGAESMVDRLRIGALSNRAPGPHFAPTGFGGIGLLALAIFWLVSDREHRWQRWIVLGCSSVIILCTVSRHVILAAVLGLAVLFFLAEMRMRMRLVAAGTVFATLLLLIGPSVGLVSSWEERTARIESGVLDDENLVARVVDGPLRLVTYLKKNPSALMVGAGLEADKIANRAQESQDSGYVSNSFLLPLYYLGIPGLLIYVGLWLWTGLRALRLSRTTRALPCGVVMVALGLIVSDNYCFDYEPVVALLFLIPGLIGGLSHRARVDQLLAALEAEEEVEPEISGYVAPAANYIVAPPGYVAMPGGHIILPDEDPEAAARRKATPVAPTPSRSVGGANYSSPTANYIVVPSGYIAMPDGRIIVSDEEPEVVARRKAAPVGAPPSKPVAATNYSTPTANYIVVPSGYTAMPDGRIIVPDEESAARQMQKIDAPKATPKPVVVKPRAEGYVPPPANYIVAPPGYVAMPDGHIIVRDQPITVAAVRKWVVEEIEETTGAEAEEPAMGVVEEIVFEGLNFEAVPEETPDQQIVDLGDVSLDSLREVVCLEG